MSTYVMSDLHGCYTDLQNMLKQINFSDEDELYIDGDIVDRGPETFEMLEWMMNAPSNVHFIMGNHDDDFVEYVFTLLDVADEELEDTAQNETNDTQDNANLGVKEEAALAYMKCKMVDKWGYFDRYGTLWNLIFMKCVTIRQLACWAYRMDQFPFYKKLTICQDTPRYEAGRERDFILVHAGYLRPELQKDVRMYGASDLENFFTFARGFALSAGGEYHTTIVAGHTPTLIEDEPFFANGKVFRYEKPEMDCVIYDIDCGNVFYGRHPEANLACIRLEDEEVIYLKRD